MVELVGPAGAGKTALLRAIGRDRRVRAGVHIDRVRLLPNLVFYTMALLPLALALLSRDPSRLWYGLLHLVRLRALPRAIARASEEDAGVILLDEGPVFSLGRLSVFQQASQGEGRLARAWHAEVDRWATRLDAVVWIDAPDAVLSERIRTRVKPHRLKDSSDTELAEFLERYRQAYREIQERFAARGRVAMMHLDTTHLAVDAAARQVMAGLERLGLPPDA